MLLSRPSLLTALISLRTALPALRTALLAVLCPTSLHLALLLALLPSPCLLRSLSSGLLPTGPSLL